MATYGSQPTFSDWYLSEENTQTQVAFLGEMPEDGYITAVNFYAGGYGGTVPGVGCVWAGDGALLFEGNGVTIPAASEGVGSQDWNTDTGDGVFVAAGTPIYIGWWRKPADSVVWSCAGYGTEYVQSTESSSPTTLSPGTQAGAIGATITFTPADAPTVNTDPATSVTGTTATLEGDAVPNGLDTQGFFEWGTTESYGNTTANQDLGSGTSDADFSQAITGLSPNTLYHFRACASNEVGTSYGPDQSFEQVIVTASGTGHLALTGQGVVPTPTVTVTAPSGANTEANPTVEWTVTVPTGQTIASTQVIIYSAAQVAAGGFSPGSGPNIWNSGALAGSARSAAPVGVPNFGNFIAYVQATTNLGVVSQWALIEWTQAVGIVAVEIGFPSTPNGNNFVLGDPVKGVLGSATYTLGGTDWVDVTQWCSGQISVSRGRSRETDQYTTGSASFSLRNEDRRFDPLNIDSPYYPGIVPRAPVNIYVGGIQVFGGYVSDYNPGYEKPSTATVPVKAQDAFCILANAYINNWTASEELTGQRILDLINDNVPGFPADMNIAAGNTLLQANLFGANSAGSDGDVALDDLQTVADSEWGFLFVDRTGTLTFLDRYAIIRQLAAGTVYATFSDLAADIEEGAFGYFGISLVSAVLLLYNQVQGTRNSDQLDSDDEPITQIANNAESQEAYLLRALQLPSIENNSDADVLALCNWVLSLYCQPEVRFDALTLELTGMDIAQLQQLAALDIPQVCVVKRTPPGSGSPTTIELLSYIDQIGWDFDVSGSTYRMNLSFGSAEDLNYFVLGSPVYGVLGTSELAY